MAQQRVQHARSSVAGAVPAAADVKVGELIINFADRTLRTKNGANALIRMNQSIPVTNVAPVDPSVGDWYLTTTGQIVAYFNPGTGVDWYNVAPSENLSGYLLKTGGVLTGQLTLPGGGAGLQAIAVSEAAALAAAAVVPALLKAGGTMTGAIVLPAAAASGLQAVGYAQMAAAIAAAVPPDLSNVLLKAGGVMTGQITLPGGGAGNQATTANELAAAIAAHAAQPDPHTMYTLTTELIIVDAAQTAALNAHKAAGGVQHPNATGAVAGFMSAADKTKLDALPATPNESFIIAVSDEVTVITAGVAKVTFRMPYAFTLASVKASLNVAASAVITTIDINEAGATILTTKLTIDVGEKTSATAATPAVIGGAGPVLAADAEMTIDIDLAGTGAKGLKVYLIGNQ